MPNVDSFNVDHRKMKAPFIRLSKSLEIPSPSHRAMTFDIRLRTPNNEEPLPLKALHSLEHLLAEHMRDNVQNTTPNNEIIIIDISPMGCRTGFYISVLAPIDSETKTAKTLSNCLKLSCQQILTVDSVPAANEIQCGTFKDHDLIGAKSICAHLICTNENIRIQDNNSLCIE